MFGYMAFHVAKLQVAMCIYKTGAKYALQLFNFFTGFFFVNNINNNTGCIGDQHFLMKELVTIKDFIC